MSDGARLFDLPPDDGEHSDPNSGPDLSLVKPPDGDIEGDDDLTLFTDEGAVTDTDEANDQGFRHAEVTFDVDPEAILGHNHLLEQSDDAKKRAILRVLSSTLREYRDVSLKGLVEAYSKLNSARVAKVKVGDQDIKKDDLFPLSETFERLFRELETEKHPVTQLYEQILPILGTETTAFLTSLRRLLVLSVDVKWVGREYRSDVDFAKARKTNP